MELFNMNAHPEMLYCNNNKVLRFKLVRSVINTYKLLTDNTVLSQCCVHVAS